MTIGKHDFENERNIQLENYQDHVSIRALNQALYTEIERDKTINYFADIVFQKLKETCQYSLMFVADLQVKLKQFNLEASYQ